MPVSPIQFCLLDTYLAYLKNSVGSKLFQDVFIKLNGEQVNATKGGQASCAVFVSNILQIFGLIKSSHATVTSTVKDLEQSGWQKIVKPLPGSVLVWEEKKLAGNENRHIGFYVGNNQAISNRSSKRVPGKHHWTYGVKKWLSRDGDEMPKPVGVVPVRKVEAIYWHPKLKN